MKFRYLPLYATFKYTTEAMLHAYKQIYKHSKAYFPKHFL